MKTDPIIDHYMYVVRDDEEIEIKISGFFDEGEAEVRYYSDGSGHPGYPACIYDITAFRAGSGGEIELEADEEERAHEILLLKATEDGNEVDYNDPVFDDWDRDNEDRFVDPMFEDR